MKLNLDIARHNLNLLQEVKSEYPILQDFEDGKIRRETVNNIGLDTFISLIDCLSDFKKNGLKLIYDEPIKYKDLKLKLSELNRIERSRKIFLNKTKNQFDEIWNNYNLHKRYKNNRNESFTPGLDLCEPMIFNYLVQNQIEVNSEYMFLHRNLWFDKLSKPKFYSRELKMTQDFISNFVDYAKTANLDLRKCNVKSLTTELHHKLKEMTQIEPGLQVRCISETFEFTVDRLYTVEDSRINYIGFLEIKLANDRGDFRYVPYSNFEEVSRQRDELLNLLGI